MFQQPEFKRKCRGQLAVEVGVISVLVRLTKNLKECLEQYSRLLFIFCKLRELDNNLQGRLNLGKKYNLMNILLVSNLQEVNIFYR